MAEPVRTFRPRGARRMIYAVVVLVLVAFGAGALVLPPEFGTADRIACVGTGLLMAAFLHRLASVRVVAGPDGLRVVNLVRSRSLDWAEVLGVRLPPGEPWLVLDLSDGTALPAMGIQGSDGELARAQATEVARLVATHTRTDPCH